MTASARECLAVTAPGLEDVTAMELRALGIEPMATLRGGVTWRGGQASVERANLWLRTASRVLTRLASFHASSFHELERRARRVEWASVLGDRRTARFRVTAQKSALYHSDAIAERLAKAAGIEPGAAEQEGDDPEDDGAQLFVVRVSRDEVAVSADSTGALLHRRGYRLATAKAPMRETLAAAMVLASGWRNDEGLLDPMCGSGTIPIEAALLGANIAPGSRRSFAFEAWPAHDAAKWTERVEKARTGERADADLVIVGSDRDAGAVEAALANAERAGVSKLVRFEHAALSAAPFPGPGGWVLANPPYGERVGSDVRNLYARLGATVRAHTGWRLGVLTADRALDRQFGLPLEQVFDTSNGGIPVRFSRSV